MENKELIEKCSDFSHEFYTHNTHCHGDCYTFKLDEYLAKAIPIIQKAERERILNQMALERGDYAVGLCFEDYYWLPKDIWQSLIKGETNDKPTNRSTD